MNSTPIVVMVMLAVMGPSTGSRILESFRKVMQRDFSELPEKKLPMRLTDSHDRLAYLAGG